MFHLTASGTVLGVGTFGGPQTETVYDVAALSGGGAIVVGSYSGQATSGGMTLSNPGSVSSFVLRVDEQADVSWVRGYGGPHVDWMSAVSERAPGEVYLGGTFDRTATYGPFYLSWGAGSPSGIYNGVLMRLTP